MFTGLIEAVGVVERAVHGPGGSRLDIVAPSLLSELKLGDSVAVNGVCLTVTQRLTRGFSADAVPETMRRTNLGRLTRGMAVNLERALRLGDRMGGHMVSGHVDGVGHVAEVAPEGLAIIVTIEADRNLMRQIAQKGSVAVDGISLTVMAVSDERFSVSIIPHTAAQTTLQAISPGAAVNIETDVIAKYVERLLGLSDPAAKNPGEGARQPLNLAFLAEHGFV